MSAADYFDIDSGQNLPHLQGGLSRPPLSAHYFQVLRTTSKLLKLSFHVSFYCSQHVARFY